MELRVLEYYLVVAREQNITHAARILHITQPTLSRQLQSLEEELGVKLFIRGKTHLTLTEEGLLLRNRAQGIVDLVNRTRAEFKQEQLSGHLVIGAGEVRSMGLIVRFMKHFIRRYPQVTFEIVSDNTEDIEEAMNRGLIDLGLFLEPVSKDTYDYIELPCKELWGLYIHKDDPLALKETIQAKDLYDIPLCVPKRFAVRSYLSHWLGDDLEKLHIIGTHNLLKNAKLLVHERVCGIISLEDVYANDQDVVFVPLEPLLETETCIAWKRHRMMSAIVKKAIEELKEEFGHEK